MQTKNPKVKVRQRRRSWKTKRKRERKKEEEYRFTTRDNEHDPRARCRNIALSDLPLCRSVLHRRIYTFLDVLCTRLAWQHRKPCIRTTWDAVYVIDRCQSTGRSKLVNDRGDLTVNLTLFARRLAFYLIDPVYRSKDVNRQRGRRGGVRAWPIMIPFDWTVLKHGVVSEADLHNKSSRRLGYQLAWIIGNGIFKTRHILSYVLTRFLTIREVETNGDDILFLFRSEMGKIVTKNCVQKRRFLKRIPQTD